MVNIDELDVLTDKYFERTMAALDEMGSPDVVAEITETQYHTGNFKVLTGVNEAAEIAKEAGVDFYSLEEGRLFDGGPVARIEGNYEDFAKFETALLGVLSHNSGMATNALKARLSANTSKALSFGVRSVHPNIGHMVSRNAMVAGFDGFSFIKAEEQLGIEATGTMPHALMLCAGRGNQEEAWEAFDEAVDDDVPRIILVDTYNDEIDEIRRAVQLLGDKLDGVRLDTTSSRRGDFERIIKEAKAHLRELGREDVDVYVSGGMGPEDIQNVDELVDGFGVGSYISEADPVDFSLDIVEVDGEPTSKRGKLPGEKTVTRNRFEEEFNNIRRVGDVEEVDKEIMVPIVEGGELVRHFEWEDARENLMDDVDTLRLGSEDI